MHTTPINPSCAHVPAGIKSRDQVLAMGVAAYNEECRSIVMRYSQEWEKTVVRLGRWIDFKNDYKTMDLGFMESVWWVFKQLHDKGLVYRGYKVRAQERAPAWGAMHQPRRTFFAPGFQTCMACDMQKP